MTADPHSRSHPHPHLRSRSQPPLRRFGAGTSALLCACTLMVGACSSSSGEATGDDTTTTFATGTVYRYVIPAGTGEAIDRGEPVDVMPSNLEIEVGDAIEIVNEDDRGHNVGLFFVGVGETVNQVFPSVAEFSDVCSVSSSGTFTITVR